MSEQSMIDQVARAIARVQVDKKWAWKAAIDENGDWSIHIDFARLLARAAIEAMRERTKEMIQVDRFDITPGCAWQAMIDAALKD